ncbi:MAG: phage major capsid protein, partial [Burkholderiales bacterium]|nr:phage major capsid protein [Burkholderiales bacterium]
MNTSTLLFRDATFGAEFDTAARTVPVTLSTEYAVDRGGYHEVLSHRDGDVDLSRAPLPLIIAHDDETLPVGTIEQLRVQDRALKGVARFGTWPRAAEAFEGVRSRIYRAVSVGYELLDDGRPESGNRNHLRFRWRPHEASIVAVGADPHAQFFRERTNMTTELSRAERRRVAAQSDAQQLLDVAGDDAAAFEEFLDEEANEHGGQRAAAVRALGGSISLAYENWRARCINLLARSWTDTIPNVLQLGKRAIAAGDSVEDFRLRLLPLIENKPLETGKLESGYQETAASYGSGARAASHFEARNDRERVERIHHAAGRWMRGSLLGSAADASWCRSAGLLQTRAAMAEGIYSAGGAAVPGLLADAVLVQSEEYGIARKECRVWPMTGAALGLPKELSAPSAGFVGENAQIPSTTPELGGLMLVPKILASLVPVSRSLAEDSIPELLGAYLLEALARRVAEVEDTCLFTADASSTYGGMTGLARMIEDPLYAGSKHTSLSGDNTLNEIE